MLCHEGPKCLIKFSDIPNHALYMLNKPMPLNFEAFSSNADTDVKSRKCTELLGP